MADGHPPPYDRIVLKISGESFAPPGETGIDPDELRLIAGEIVEACEGREMAVVCGGGNLIRGAPLAAQGQINRATADYMGMLATVINGVALKEALEAAGQPARLMSALEIPRVAEPFIRGRALRHMEKGRVVVLVAGTGNPYFTTDTCAAQRAAELGADVLLKATKVDGVYTADPHQDADAVRFETLTFREALDRQLRVMDLTAMTMCMEQAMRVVVFDFKQHGNIRRVSRGESIGTLITT